LNWTLCMRSFHLVPLASTHTLAKILATLPRVARPRTLTCSVGPAQADLCRDFFCRAVGLELSDGCTPAALDHFRPASGAKATLAIEVISDAICPWCWIAKRRLDSAIAMLAPDVTATVTWRPFELNPEMPKGGVYRRAYRSAKFGSWQHSQANPRVSQSGSGIRPSVPVRGTAPFDFSFQIRGRRGPTLRKRGECPPF
jgi:hypothetical protein